MASSVERCLSFTARHAAVWLALLIGFIVGVAYAFSMGSAEQLSPSILAPMPPGRDRPERGEGEYDAAAEDEAAPTPARRRPEQAAREG